MNPSCIVLRISLFVFIPLFSFGQSLVLDSGAFYNHLKKEKMIAEQVSFAKMIYDHSPHNIVLCDSLLLDLAQSYSYINRNDLATESIRNISDKPLFSKNRYELLISLLIGCKEYKEVEAKIPLIQSEQFKNDAALSLLMLSGKSVKDTAFKNLSPLFFDLKSRYVNRRPYSPVAAACLSAVLPGAGKWYIGNKRQAVSSLVSHLFLAAQAIESYRKAGISSTRFILTSSLFSVFYIGNIWGSALAAKKKKKDIYNEIDYEISNYYADRSGGRANDYVLPDKQIADILLKREIDFFTSPDSLKSMLLLEKAAFYKYETDNEKIESELRRALSFAFNDSFRDRVNYQRMLNFFLSDKFSECLNVDFDKSDAVSISKEKEYLVMKLIAYNETEQWAECKRELLLYLNNSDSAKTKEVTGLPESYAFINPQQCSRLSSIIPGLGMVKAKKPLKGVVSFAIQSGTLLFAAYQIYSGYYFTSIVSGVFPFSKFYSGGKRLSAALAYRNNEEESKQLKARYSSMIKQVLMQ